MGEGGGEDPKVSIILQITKSPREYMWDQMATILELHGANISKAPLCIWSSTLNESLSGFKRRMKYTGKRD